MVTPTLHLMGPRNTLGRQECVWCGVVLSRTALCRADVVMVAEATAIGEVRVATLTELVGLPKCNEGARR